jgi:hypothetical protein
MSGVARGRGYQEGGWGAANDDQTCPSCGRAICGADMSRKSDRDVKCPNSGVCHSPAGYRTDHPGIGACKWHYGNTPAQKQNAAKKEIRQRMRLYGEPVTIDPEEALVEEIHRTVGHIRWLSDVIASLDEGGDAPRVGSPAGRVINPDGDPDDKAQTDLESMRAQGDEVLVWGIQEREVQAGGPGGGFDRVKVGAGVNMWLQVYMAERKHLADITRIAMAAGLESRRQDWAEAMAGRMLDALEAVITELGLDPAEPRVRLVVANQLDALAGRNRDGAATA